MLRNSTNKRRAVDFGFFADTIKGAMCIRHNFAAKIVRFAHKMGKKIKDKENSQNDKQIQAVFERARFRHVLPFHGGACGVQPR